MSAHPVWLRSISYTGATLAAGVCLTLVLNLSPAYGVIEDASVATGVAAANNASTLRIAAGGGHSLALKADGSLWAWGYNTYGQIGDGTRTDRRSPVQVLAGIVTMAGGEGHTLASQIDNGVNRTFAWGWNLDGQLGDGTTTDRLNPVLVTVGLSQMLFSSFLEAGDHHSLAIWDSHLYTWGNNLSGQIGDDSTIRRLNPFWVDDFEVAATAGGRYQTLALLTDGTVWAWGANWGGQLGDGTVTERHTPVQVRQGPSLFLSGVVAVASGDHHSLAIKGDGSLWAWGSNSDGQIGDGTVTSRVYPVQVLSGVVAVAGGNWHTLALRNDGSLWAWGDNPYGQLGDGTGTDRLSPVQVLTGVAAIAAGGWHSMAVKTDGSLWAWGWNPWGQLGDGTTTTSWTPVQVSGFGPAPAPASVLNAAVLPYARAVAIGQQATAFASVINSGSTAAVGCSIAPPGGVPGNFTYQTTNAANVPVGTSNTPVDIPPGATQGFVFGITPSTAMAATEIPLVFDCANTVPAASHAGLNTFILSAAASAPPDLLAIGATPSQDGVVRLPSRNGIGFFATAAVNIGSSGTVRVSADDGGRGLPLTLGLCETNAAGGQIACGSALTRSVSAGQTVFYTVFVTGAGQSIAFDPANNRLFLRFKVDGTTVGATNVAVTAP